MVINKKKYITKKKIILSIVAGVRISKIQKIFFKKMKNKEKKLIKISRIMPNTPALVSSSVSGFCLCKNSNTNEMKTIQIILNAFGKSVFFEKEKFLNAVTALSGTGPAYFFYFLEAMFEAGKNIGLSKKDALFLTEKTIKGSIILLEKSNEDVKVLRQKVTSKGGTTEAAIKFLEKKKFKENIAQAIKIAFLRSKELG